MNNYQMKILIVDDERANLEVLSRILKPGNTQANGEYIEPIHDNYTLCVAKSGAAAIKKAAEERPDLILLDIVMPGMSGFEVLSALKSSTLTRDIPVIIITGLDSVHDEEKGFLLGAVDYITKPFHNSLVRARVKIQLRLIEQMRTIEMLGLIDTLTGIPNRRGFDNRMTTEWGRSIREVADISLLMIDIDFFKKFNDKYGHQQGDAALKVVAGTAKAALKRPSDFVARWGGEEFAVILPGTDMEGAVKVAEDIRERVEIALIPSIGGGSPLHVTISIGVVSTIPGIGSEIADFITQADMALYAAKSAGRNRICS